MRSVGWVGALCQALFLVVLLVCNSLPLVAGKAEDHQPGEEGSCIVDSACLTSLALTAQKDPAALSGYKNVSTAVLSCVGAKSAVIRPLRLLLPNTVEPLLTQLGTLIADTTGWDLDVQYAPPATIGAMVLDTEATGRTYYDGWVMEASWTPDLAIQGMIEPLDNYVNADPEIEWLDVSRFIRTACAVFNGSVVGVPTGGYTYLMHWRRDVFERAGLSPPNTWREAITVAKALNGTDFNKDGIPDFSLCLDIFNSSDTSTQDPASLISQILASHTQTQGAGSGWLFSPDTMESFVDSPAMTESLEILNELMLYTQRFAGFSPTGDDLFAHPFVKGGCALHFANAETFKATQLFGKFKGLFGSAPLPGSDLVLDRKTGKLVSCSTELCPYATWAAPSISAQGQPPPAPQLVNRATYSSFTSTLGMINANSLSIYKAAVYRVFALFSSYRFQLQVDLLPGPVAPFRQRLLSRTNASLALWTSRGYNKADIAGYLSATQATLDHPNNALDLRIQHALEYRWVFVNATKALASGQDVATVQSYVSARYAAITASTPLQQLGDGYLAGLNVKHRFVLPISPPPPSPPSFPPPPGVSSSSSSSGPSTGQVVGIVVGSVMGGLILVVVAVVLVVARGRTHRRWGFFGTHLPPGVGAGTTLVVTDIENSTLLWEKITQDVMNVALELHHTLVRKLLVKHQGYESATEGDSFIAAFHTPLNALQFSQAFQAGLLVLDWPAEVLACRLSCPVWIQPNGALRKPDKPGFGLVSRQITGVSTPGVADTILAVHSPPDCKPTASTGNLRQPSLALQRFRLRVESLRDISKFALNESPTPPASPLHITPHELSKVQTALLAITDDWIVCDAPLPHEEPSAEGKHQVYRGLRVRIGLHSGLDNPTDAVPNATTGRMQYCGLLLYTAKAVGDCGHGGMVLLSHACFNALPSASLQNMGSVLNMGEFAFTKAGGSDVVPPGALYQVVASDMQPRLALLDCKLRSVTQLQVGVLQAPVNHACIAFANVVGAATLMAWDANIASQALELYQRKAVELLLAPDAGWALGHRLRSTAGVVLADAGNEGFSPQPEPPGYVVELASGLCLAAFQTPSSALLWALRLIEGLLNSEWDPELLGHELCEEVCIGGSGVSTYRNVSVVRTGAAGQIDTLNALSEGPGTMSHSVSGFPGAERSSAALKSVANRGGVILFRGLRLKIGVDMGSVHANINPCTGRMAYRGRMMNRSARIADKAGSGQVWCSKAVADAQKAANGLGNVIQAHALGSFNLKGVTEPVELLQCELVEAHADPRVSDFGCFASTQSQRLATATYL